MLTNSSPRSDLPRTTATCSKRSVFQTWGLAQRSILVGGLFVLELIAISTWLDTSALDGKGGLTGTVGTLGPYILQALIVLITVLLALGYSKAKPSLLSINNRLAEMPLGWGFLAAHCAAMGAFVVLSMRLFGGADSGENLLVFLWLAAGICGIAAASFVFVPPKICSELAGSAGSAWMYASAAAVITPLFVIVSERLWKPATALTFELVRFLVRPFGKVMIANAATKTIGTQNFRVQIASSCSGLEGVGLMLIFSVLWLWFFRADYKFPRALLLIPIGVTVIFLLNAVRIATLIMIGDAGARAIAVGGFHSQAGWIAFNGVALSLACIAHRVPWLSSRRAHGTATGLDNPPAAYLMPFLAILTAAMVSRAAAGNFEWMYPLRFVAGAIALFLFRSKYASLYWRCGWVAPLAGVLVFVLWIDLDRIAGTHVVTGMPLELSAASEGVRTAWLVVRTLAAVITVPLAEELAFRGFLLRRLMSADFESVGFQRWSFLSVALSSLGFGLLHGDRWIAGTLAGVLYALAQKWRGRIGDAVVAHGVTNALISVWVLWGGHWSLW